MTPEESNLSELLEFAENLADTAEVPVLSHFRSKLDIEDKSDSSPVTVADRSATVTGLESDLSSISNLERKWERTGTSAVSARFSANSSNSDRLDSSGVMMNWSIIRGSR